MTASCRSRNIASLLVVALAAPAFGQTPKPAPPQASAPASATPGGGELMEDIVEDMRNYDIGLSVVKGDAFRVSFAADDPRVGRCA